MNSKDILGSVNINGFLGHFAVIWIFEGFQTRLYSQKSYREYVQLQAHLSFCRTLPGGLDELGDTGVRLVRVVSVGSAVVAWGSPNAVVVWWNWDWNEGSLGATPFCAKASPNEVCELESTGFDSQGRYWGWLEIIERPFSERSRSRVSV